jgi:hypothetical protein
MKKMKRTLLIGCMILVLMMPVVVSAATLNFVYENQYETDMIRFDIIDVTSGRNLDFFDVPLIGWDISTDAAGWTDYIINDRDSLVFSAPANASIMGEANNFNLWIWDWAWEDDFSNFDFTLAWTESLDGNVQGAGTIDFEDGVMVPTPLPASAWMLLSGLAMFVGVRRRNAG